MFFKNIDVLVIDRIIRIVYPLDVDHGDPGILTPYKKVRVVEGDCVGFHGQLVLADLEVVIVLVVKREHFDQAVVPK